MILRHAAKQLAGLDPSCSTCIRSMSRRSCTHRRRNKQCNVQPPSLSLLQHPPLTRVSSLTFSHPFSPALDVSTHPIPIVQLSAAMSPLSTHSQSSSEGEDLTTAIKTAVSGSSGPPLMLAAQSPPIGVFPEQIREKETSIEMIKQGKWYGHVSRGQ